MDPRDPPSIRDLGDVALATHPPQARSATEAEEAIYAKMKNRIAIRHVSDDPTVSFIEIISPGDKRSALEVENFCGKVAQFLEGGEHFRMIDVLPPGKHDPRGMHAAFREYAFGETPGATAEEPFGCAAYRIDFLENLAPYPTSDAAGRIRRTAAGDALVPDVPTIHQCAPRRHL